MPVHKFVFFISFMISCKRKQMVFNLQKSNKDRAISFSYELNFVLIDDFFPSPSIAVILIFSFIKYLFLDIVLLW